MQLAHTAVVFGVAVVVSVEGRAGGDSVLLASSGHCNDLAECRAATSLAECTDWVRAQVTHGHSLTSLHE